MRVLHTPAEWKARSRAAAALAARRRVAAAHRWRRAPGSPACEARRDRARRTQGAHHCAARLAGALWARVARLVAIAFGNARLALLRKMCGAGRPHRAPLAARAVPTGGGLRTWLVRSRDGGAAAAAVEEMVVAEAEAAAEEEEEAAESVKAAGYRGTSHTSHTGQRLARQQRRRRG